MSTIILSPSFKCIMYIKICEHSLNPMICVITEKPGATGVPLINNIWETYNFKMSYLMTHMPLKTC